MTHSDWGRCPDTGALVCGGEVCRAAAVEDNAAARDGRLGEDAARLISEAKARQPRACAYCGLINWELERADARERAAKGRMTN